MMGDFSAINPRRWFSSMLSRYPPIKQFWNFINIHIEHKTIKRIILKNFIESL